MTSDNSKLFSAMSTASNTFAKRGDNSYEVWFHNMDRNQEGCIWTGNFDQLVYDEELEVRFAVVRDE